MKNILVQKGERFSLSSKVGDLCGWRLSPTNLSDGEKAVIFNYSYQVGLKAFVQESSPEMEADIYGHLFKEDNLFIVMNNDPTQEENTEEAKVVAFLTTRDIDFQSKKILYLSGTCVDPPYQGRGISGRLINEAYKFGSHYDVMALRTQNPVMKQCFDNCIGGKSHPGVDTEVPEEIKEIGLFMANLFVAKNYQTQSLIMKGIYGGCLYGRVPISSNESYNSLFNRLDKLAGDSLLCVKVLV